MLSELNKDRHKALKVLAEYLKTPPRDLQLCAILKDVKDKDLRWVNEKMVGVADYMEKQKMT